MPASSIIVPIPTDDLLRNPIVQHLVGTLSGAEIILVDNGSSRSSASFDVPNWEAVRMLRLPATTLSDACNAAANTATGDYLIFLEPATMPTSGWLAALTSYADEHPGAAAVGSKLLSPDNTVWHAGIVWCGDQVPRFLYRGLAADQPAVNKSRSFQAVITFGGLVRREAFIAIGGFDPDLADGFESVDLSLRLRQLGYDIHYCHRSVLYRLTTSDDQTHLNPKSRAAAIFRARWADRVVQDDFKFYVGDGLLRIKFCEQFPVRLTVSPPLVPIDEMNRALEMDQLLRIRMRQVHDLFDRIGMLDSELRDLGGRQQHCWRQSATALTVSTFL